MRQQPLHKEIKIQMEKIQKSQNLNNGNLYKNQNQKKLLETKMDEWEKEQKMIKEEYDSLIEERQQQIKRNQLSCKNEQICLDANYQPTKFILSNKHNFNLYADKLLMHLVVEEEFDFATISDIMTYTFGYQRKLYNEQTCRQRWYELHINRSFQPTCMKQSQLQLTKDKSLGQQKNQQKTFAQKTKELHQQKQHRQLQNIYQGYSIFKDKFRKIDDIEKHNQLQKQMKCALQKAAQSIELQKPMLYTPYYERLQQFQVVQQELTLQKMQQMMSHPIEIELMQRELKILDLNQINFESKAKKDFQKKLKQQKIKNQQEFEIQENWDEYESD